LWSDGGVPITSEQSPRFDFRTLRAHAVRVASEAAQLVADVRAAGLSDISTKSTETDVVTSGDRAVERLIRERLDEIWPGVPVIGEEEGGRAPADGLSWVVDPIDGTVNYLYGYPCYAVSVAAQVDGVSVAGAVADPAGDRMWTASRGDGARLNGRLLNVSAATRLELALVATGFAYAAQRRVRQAALWAALLPRVRDLRRPGASSLDLCAVAAGWVDAYVEHGLHRWDWAAGALIAEEAGAVVRLPTDRDIDGLGADVVFAATPGIADALRVALIDCGAGSV
jgi:myo-inositol-1(or 4)-monophosphatase